MTLIFPQLRSAKVTHSWMGFVAYTSTPAHIGKQDGSITRWACGSGISLATYFGCGSGSRCWAAPRETRWTTSLPDAALYPGILVLAPSIFTTGSGQTADLTVIASWAVRHFLSNRFGPQTLD